MTVSAITNAPNAVNALFNLPGVDAPAVAPGERIRLIRPAALPDTEWILAAGSARIWRVFHEDYEFCILPPEADRRHAGATYSYRTWDVSCEPGAAYLLEPDTLHANRRILGPANYFVVKVQHAAVSTIARELGMGDSPHFRSPATDSRAVLGAFRAVAASVARSADPLEQATLLLRALSAALLECAERRPAPTARDAPRPALERVRERLHERFAETVTLDELVALSGLSRSHLVRSFAKRYGAPPHAYRAQVRAAEARRQLALGVRPPAVDVGFYDQSHLGRHFRRAYAVTPGAYLRARSGEATAS